MSTLTDVCFSNGALTVLFQHLYSFKERLFSADSILMTITARTRGYVAIGMGPKPSMINADIILLWMDEQRRPHALVRVDISKRISSFSHTTGRVQ